MNGREVEFSSDNSLWDNKVSFCIFANIQIAKECDENKTIQICINFRENVFRFNSCVNLLQGEESDCKFLGAGR